MKLEMFDKVKLKTGEIAYVVEIHKDGEAYEMDIDTLEGPIKTDTIYSDQISEKIE